MIRLTLSSLIWSLILSTNVHGKDYYFSASGNDTDPGTQALPKKSLAHAATLMAPGVNILLKRGDVWYQGANTWNVTNKTGKKDSLISVGAYGIGTKPMITTLGYLTGGWVNEGGNIWSHTLSYTIKRCWVNGSGKKSVSLANLNSSTQFANENGKVYVYASNPPANAEVLPFKHLLYVKNVSYIVFRDIEFCGGQWCTVLAEAPTSNVSFENCDVRKFGNHGIQYMESSVTSEKHFKPSVIGCHVNKDWSMDENLTTGSPGGDGIVFLNTADSGLMKRNIIIDVGHTGMRFSGENKNYSGVHNCVMEMNEVSSVNVNYVRGFEVMGVEGKSTNNIIRRNYFHDMLQASKVFGNNNKIYSNLLVKHRKGVGTSPADEALEMVTYYSTIVSDTFVSKNNIIVNNTVYDTEGSSIRAYYSGTGQNIIRNNLLVKFGLSPGGYGVQVHSNVSAPQIVENNCFWNTSSTDKVIYVEPASYTVSQANSQLAAFKNNLQSDPQFVNATSRDFHLKATSPCIAAGQLLTNMGAGFVDYEGNPFDPSKPSIGAFQYKSITTAINNLAAPFKFSSGQNFPNPFHENTWIQVSLEETAFIKIFLLDLSGKIVLEKEYGLLASGEHALLLEGTGLPAGVYLYTITSGRKPLTGKMMIY